MDLYHIKLPLDGRYLKALRAGRNQRAIEADMPLPRGKLSQYERAICVAPINHIKAIARFYGVTPLDILSQGGRNAVQQLLKLHEGSNNGHQKQSE